MVTPIKPEDGVNSKVSKEISNIMKGVIDNPESEAAPALNMVFDKEVMESAVDVPEEYLKKLEKEKIDENLNSNKLISNNQGGQLEGMDPETGNYIRPKNIRELSLTKTSKTNNKELVQNDEKLKSQNLDVSNNNRVTKKSLQRGVNFFFLNSVLIS